MNVQASLSNLKQLTSLPSELDIQYINTISEVSYNLLYNTSLELGSLTKDALKEYKPVLRTLANTKVSVRRKQSLLQKVGITFIHLIINSIP